ncbi:outer membrane protein assembly factor BamA [Ectothiorhodospira mobilis]|uniref:outer membrane protein assembly factor BamA n=1 Tax=Ectothiorhodospira mobilis TaxID=195064 RepID=UPI0019069F51|nr:outer membrane protein assembly factor BamA [Ectothiorhodospira mobilis]MBK1692317.1 outer membrane protein assembly factor BamA [Ectothiorhodospira mobilis]
MLPEVQRLIAGAGLVLSIAAPASLHAEEEGRFIIGDIRVEGLERITPGTVYSYLPLEVGDAFDPGRSPQVIQTLYETGFFSDVRLSRRDDTLVVRVEERPAINEIRISGNRDIKTEQLEEALRQVGLDRGRVFNRGVLERLENELLQQYFARGKYNVQVDVQVEPLERNRVDVIIDIAEGQVARIRDIRVVGNETYSDETILDRFESGNAPWYNPFSRRDQYSKQRLSGDLERLRSLYLDSGFLNFNLDSTQVTLTPDFKDLYVTINVQEGEQYRIRGVKLAGELIVDADELRELLQVEAGDIFSRRRVTESAEALTRRLGDEGYAFANVNPIPEVDEDNGEVDLTFFVDPGQRVYVRRIHFHGNERTRDEVLRREMRQMEAGWYDASRVERSRVRLQRLPYIQDVNVETRRVPGSANQVDLDVTVEERLSGNFMIGAGYSQSDGVLLNLSLSEDNFLGSGNRVSVTLNNSQVNTVYSLSYMNPYYTLDGISRGFNLYYRETDAYEADISRYSSDRFGADVTYGIPLTEYDTFRITPGIEGVDVITSDYTPDEIFDYLDREGNDYQLYTLGASLSHDTRNRTVFAEKGNLQRLGLDLSLPGSDLEYYKLSYRNQHYLPLRERLVLRLSGEVAYGDAYGDTSDLPFFEKYFAGGYRSVRGFEDYTLGAPGTRDSEGDPYGGNFRLLGGAELIFPPPFMQEADNMRMSVFLDAGQVYPTYEDFEAGEIRFSTGVGWTWLSPVGALTFSLAEALNDKPDDELQTFQFNIGASF